MSYVHLTWRWYLTTKDGNSSMVTTFWLATAKSFPDPGWNLTWHPPSWNSFLYKSLYSCDMWVVILSWIQKDECNVRLTALQLLILARWLRFHTWIPSWVSYEQRILSVGWKSNDLTIPSHLKSNNALSGYIHMYHETSKHNELIIKLQKERLMQQSE